MNHSAPFFRAARPGRSLRYRPWLELLERRLPPGDVFWGLLLGSSALTPDIDKEDLPEAGSGFRIVAEPEWINDGQRPEGPDGVGEGASSAKVVDEPEQRPEDVTFDVAAPGARMSAGYHSMGTNRALADMGSAFGGLAAPGRASLTNGQVPAGLGNPAYRGSSLSVTSRAAADMATSETPSDPQRSEILDNYGKLPMSFEQNVGQFDERVDFVSRSGGSTLFLTPTAMVMSIQNSESRIQNSESADRRAGGVNPLKAARPQGVDTPRSPGVALHMQIVGGNPDTRATASDQQSGITNYLIGNDPNEWHTDIGSFGRVEYDEVYPGIDLAYYGKNNQLEYDFIVSPGADPSRIALNFAGADGMEINPQGELVVHTSVGDVVQQKPFTCQGVGNTRREVASAYIIQGDTVRFQVGNYDASRPLVIDPVVLGYSTFLGGSLTDAANGIAVDSSGNAYVTGSASSSTFPMKPGSYDTGFNGVADVFVSKINSAGTGLIYSTFLGGSSSEAGYALAIDGSGYAYVTGYTSSTNFPTTNFAFDTSHNGASDVFVLRLNPLGSELHYSTFLGGSSSEAGTAIAINNDFEAFVTGETQSANFPTTPGAFDTTFNSASFGDAFVTKVTLISFVFDLDYSTFLGGLDIDHGTGIAVDASQNAYVSGYTNSGNFPITTGAFDTTMNGGYDAVITKLNAAGSALLYSTYLGGIGSDFGDGIDIDASGNAYITGSTSSGEFPVTSGAFDISKSGIYDAYVFKLNAAGSAPVYSTYLGGTQDESGNDIQVDASGNAFVAGFTNSSNFPSTPDAFDKSLNAFADAFVTRLNAAGSTVVYSTFLGGLANEHAYGVAVDDKGGIYVTGDTTSSNFPTSPTAFDTTYAAGGIEDAFVTKLHGIPAPCGCFNAHTISTVANGALGVIAADVDSDGDTDVVSASTFDDKITWYENNGSQTFTAYTITTLANGASSVFATDMDGDGDTDILSSSYYDDKIAWYKNNGSELFTALTITTQADGASSVFAADVDSDGDIDVLSSSLSDDKIAWYKNDGNQNFTAINIALSADIATSVYATDLDYDGDIDVVSSSLWDNKIAWYKNDGNENFTKLTISITSATRNVFAADVDSDGDTDVLSAGDDKVVWHKNDGSGNFTTHTVTTGLNTARSVFAADIDADGDIDVLSASMSDNKIAWYKNDGNENFTTQVITTAAIGAASVFAADMDGDGDQDVLSASRDDNKIAWYENLRLFDVSNTNDSGPGSLRDAILDSNAIPGVDTITFSLGSGVQTIVPTTALPIITDPVIIDGTTKIDYAGTPLVVLSGANITTQSGLHVTAGNSTIKGLVINGFTFGVAIRLETAGGNVVTGNYLGTNATGTAAVKNNIGVYVLSDANTIGGTTAGSRNLISGNGAGIHVDTSANSNIIQGNFIGTDVAGTAAVGNSVGVRVWGNSNLVGGTVAGAGNRIALNVAEGGKVETGTGNAIRQNSIYGNGGFGIDLESGGNNNQAKPSVNLATSGGGTTTITATLVSAPTTTYTLEFFSSPTCDPSTFGEGETYLGSKTLTTKSTGRGRTIFVAGVEVPVGHVITATATSPGNDTSEFSKCFTVT